MRLRARASKLGGSQTVLPDGDNPHPPTRWRGLTARQVAVRLFFTCWLVYGLHFSTDIVREHYPAIALGDRFSFRLDEFGGLHPDLFEKEGYGWHIGNNPGVSMLAAIPYALARPVIDPVVRKVQERRRVTGARPPEYDSPWPNARRFFREAWERGLDVKLGLAAAVTQMFFMAPLSALSVVLVFYVLRFLVGTDRRAFWLAILYAFGTPVFYRAAFLNHNMAMGIIAFGAFVAMWDPGGTGRFSPRTRFVLAGLGGGMAVLFDYSGVVLLSVLFLYGLARYWTSFSWPHRFRSGLWFMLGALVPILLLLVYQWRSFGNPFLPGQHWMPPVEWIELGYQGYGPPQLELLIALAFDYRFGVFAFSPFLLLALLIPWANRGAFRILPRREVWAIVLIAVGMWVFFAGSNYTRLQYNTGVRYLSPIIPFLFLLVVPVLSRFRALPAYVIGVFSIGWMWSLAMYREVERPLGVLDPVVQTLTDGFDLPVLRTLEQLGGAYGGFALSSTSPLPLFALTAALIAGIWLVGRRA
jgi:hypothetical protein